MMQQRQVRKRTFYRWGVLCQCEYCSHSNTCCRNKSQKKAIMANHRRRVERREHRKEINEQLNEDLYEGPPNGNYEHY